MTSPSHRESPWCTPAFRPVVRTSMVRPRCAAPPAESFAAWIAQRWRRKPAEPSPARRQLRQRHKPAEASVTLHIALRQASRFFHRSLLQFSFLHGVAPWLSRLELPWRTLTAPEMSSRLDSSSFHLLEKGFSPDDRFRGLLPRLLDPSGKRPVQPPERLLILNTILRQLGQAAERALLASANFFQHLLGAPPSNLQVPGIRAPMKPAPMPERSSSAPAGFVEHLGRTAARHRRLGDTQFSQVTLQFTPVLPGPIRPGHAAGRMPRTGPHIPVGISRHPAVAHLPRRERLAASTQRRDRLIRASAGASVPAGHQPIVNFHVPAPKLPVAWIKGFVGYQPITNSHRALLPRRHAPADQRGLLLSASTEVTPPTLATPVRIEFRETSGGRSGPSSPVPLIYARVETAAVKALASLAQDLDRRLGEIRTPTLAAVAAEVDVRHLTRQVYDQFERELRIERERRGR